MTKKKSKPEEVTDEQILDPTAEDAPSFIKNHADEEEKVTEESKPEAKVEVNPTEQLQAQLDEMKDKYLRLSAEFDNYRKRSLKEKMDLTKYASEDVLKSILPVVDDFERAIMSLEISTDMDAIKQGLHLISNKFSDFLKTKGVSEIEAVGKELNTDLHEAITKIPVQEEDKKGKIVDVILKGYTLNDKVIRFSKVVIGE
ncbi:MAG TPA: nucleotide exchange factor GrpE [Bacteroidales bacterium]|nr:nucleotide exchange factor GrpE [Bacteroidales bacterium]